MSHTPNRRLHDDGGNGSGSGHHGHPSGVKYQHEDQGTNYGLGGKVSASVKHDHHAPHDISKDGRIPKITPRGSDSREADKRPPLLPNMFRVPTSNDPPSGHGGAENKTEHRESRENTKENKVEARETKSESRESVQVTKSEKHDGRVDDAKDTKLERESYVDAKGHEKLDKDAYGGSHSQWNWKDHKEPYRAKQYPDAPAPVGKVEPWKTSVLGVHGPSEAAKESPRVDDKDISVAREDVGENKVDMKLDDKFKDKDRKAKEVKHWWGERAKDKNDRGSSLQPGNSSSENKEAPKEEKDSEQWGTENKELTKEKEKINEKENDNAKKESWNASDKDSTHNDVEMVDAPGEAVELEKSALEQKTRDHDPKSFEREARDKKKEREGDVEPERPEKRVKYHEEGSDDGSIHVEGGAERERDALNSGVQQRKRMLLPKGSPQAGNHIRISANDSDGSHGKTDVSCVVYKVGECMQELIKLWNEYKSKADKASEGSQTGPTLEIRIPAEHVTATNRQVRGGQLWGTDIYTVDSDLVAVLMHTGYCRPTASTPPSAAQELRATVRVLPSQECYISTLRNNVRSRAWGAASDCSYRVERCCIVKKGGGIIDLEPCLTHSSTMEPTLAPVAVERTMTTRAAALNALRQQRFVREVTILFNLCMEPWLKYSISTVADKGLKKSLFTSARLKKGEVLYVETHSRRYELCFNGEKLIKAAAASHGAENGRTQNHNHHLANGEKTGGDIESGTVDTFRWSRCKNPLPQKTMLGLGIPLPLDRVEVLEESIEWDDIGWSQTGVWVAGKEYHLARAHFLAPN